MGTLAGLGFTALAVRGSTVGALLAQRIGQLGVPVWPKMALSVGYGAAGAVILSLTLGETLRLPTRGSYYASLSYLILLGSVAAFACYLTLLDRVGSVPAGYVGVLVPVLALVVSISFEGYLLTPTAYFGIALALIGSFTMHQVQAR